LAIPIQISSSGFGLTAKRYEIIKITKKNRGGRRRKEGRRE
jgi:hypothetical protein